MAEYCRIWQRWISLEESKALPLTRDDDIDNCVVSACPNLKPADMTCDNLTFNQVLQIERISAENSTMSMPPVKPPSH